MFAGVDGDGNSDKETIDGDNNDMKVNIDFNHSVEHNRINVGFQTRQPRPHPSRSIFLCSAPRFDEVAHRTIIPPWDN